jgi:hypothetical protein
VINNASEEHIASIFRVVITQKTTIENLKISVIYKILVFIFLQIRFLKALMRLCARVLIRVAPIRIKFWASD